MNVWEIYKKFLIHDDREKTVDKFKLQIFRIDIKIRDGDRGMGFKILYITRE